MEPNGVVSRYILLSIGNISLTQSYVAYYNFIKPCHLPIICILHSKLCFCKTVSSSYKVAEGLCWQVHGWCHFVAIGLSNQSSADDTDVNESSFMKTTIGIS